MIKGTVFSHDKHILLALEKNAFHNHSKPVSPSKAPNPHQSGLPTGSPHWYCLKKEDPHLHTRDGYKNKA
jgi:hypothetical protein